MMDLCNVTAISASFDKDLRDFLRSMMFSCSESPEAWRYETISAVSSVSNVADKEDLKKGESEQKIEKKKD